MNYNKIEENNTFLRYGNLYIEIVYNYYVDMFNIETYDVQ